MINFVRTKKGDTCDRQVRTQAETLASVRKQRPASSGFCFTVLSDNSGFCFTVLSDWDCKIFTTTTTTQHSRPASPATRDRIANSQSGSGHCAESVFLRVGRHQLINKELQTFDKVCPPPLPSAECTFKEEVRHKSLCLHFLQSDNH